MSTPEPSGAFGRSTIGLDDDTHARPNGSGRGPTGRPGRRGRPPGPSTRPALIVVGLTVALFIVGAIAGGLASRGSVSPTSSSVASAPGSGLRAVPARHLLTAIETPGLPPDDLVAALAVPRGTSAVPGSALNHGVELYDRSLGFAVAAPQAAVIRFFRAQLPFDHWHVVGQGPVPGGPGYRVLAQHPASDGHEWEVGVTIEPTTFPATVPSSSPTAPGASSSAATSPGPSASATSPGETTPFTLRVYALSDQQ